MTATPHEPARLRLGWQARPERHTLLLRLRPHLPLAGLIVLSALVNLWGLSGLGDANDFYAAAVKAGSESWKAFFYGSFDSASYITVDKPPASLWVMDLSSRLFGFSTLSMLVPQALEGIAAVALLYATVRRRFGVAAASLAGVILALTPVAALMFRYNNPDALLLLLLVLAAYALTRALEQGRSAWLLLAGAALGFGFLTKMLEAFLVVPAFAAAYLLAAPTSLRRRVAELAAAGAALLLAGGWWVAVVELVPAADRPYIGGSTDNSILDLIWGYNGLGRIEGGSGGAGFSGSPGLLRLFNSELGGQISWLLPAALVVLVVGLLASLRAPRTDPRRAALLLWGGWLVVAGVVFSFMSGIIHPYYTNILAPPLAVLTGVGAVELWRRRRHAAVRVLLALTLAGTCLLAVHLLGRSPSWHPQLRDAILAAGVLASVTLLVAHRLPRAGLAALAATAALAGLGAPVAYTFATVTGTQSGSIVSAGPAVATSGGGFGGRPGSARPGAGSAAGGGGFPAGSTATGSRPPRGTAPAGAARASSSGFAGRGAAAGGAPGGQGATLSAALTKLLSQSPASYTWVAAAASSQAAAPIELATGKAVMALGGFSGSDPAITLARFKALVAAGKIHYYIASGGGGGAGGPGGGSSAISQISAWVAHTFSAQTLGGTTIYDLAG